MKGKKTTASKKKETKKWFNGKRCLHISLFDGTKHCLAMEYSPIPTIHDNLLGAKVLLTGPFDVYAGVILLRQHHIKILSDLTFYPAPQSKQKTHQISHNTQEETPHNTHQNPPDILDDIPQNHNNNHQNQRAHVQQSDDDFDNLLNDDFGDPFDDQIVPETIDDDDDMDCFLMDFPITDKKTTRVEPEIIEVPEVLEVPEVRQTPRVVQVPEVIDILSDGDYDSLLNDDFDDL